MKSPPAPPYLLPSDDCVSARAWMTEHGVALEDRLEHWDPFTDLALVRTVEIDLDRVRSACQLGPDSAFAIAVSWHASRTRLAGTAQPVELGTLDGHVRAPIAIAVPGTAAGGRLDLRNQLILRHAGSEPSPISPRRTGAILWSDETRVVLEGGAARFPVTVADFAGIPGLPDKGSWALEWDADDLEAPVSGGLRLLINAADEALVGAVRSGSSDARASLVRSFVTFDVARSLVHRALASDQFIADPESFEDGSVGRMLFELFAMCWPGVPLRTLRSRTIDDAPRLDAELQARLGILG